MAQAQKTAEKLQRIVNNPNCSESFSKKEIVGGLVNLQDAQSKLTSFECLYIQKILQRFEADNSQRLLNHKQYLDWCNEMISHFDMVAPYCKYCGNDLMEFLDSIWEDDKKAFRAKAKKLLENGKLFAIDNWSFSNEWSALNHEFKSEFYDDDTTDFIENIYSGNTGGLFDCKKENDNDEKNDAIDDENNNDEEFLVSEDDAEIIATFFKQGITDVEVILKKLKWNDKKQKQFIDFLFMMDLLNLENIEDDDGFVVGNTPLLIDGNKLQEFFDDLPIDFGDDFFDQEWHDDCCKTLKELIEEMATNNPTFKSKNKYALNDVDMLIGMSFCCITSKPKDLCQAVQSAVKELANKNELSLDEIKALIDRAFVSFVDDEIDDEQ